MRLTPFTSAVIFSMVLNVAGLIVNLFIVVVNYKTWVESRRSSSSDKILFSVGITRFLMLGLFVLYINYFLISSDAERSVRISNLYLFSWLFLDSSGLWFVTLLNVLYCVKITNFRHSVFLLLKRNLSPKTPRLLLACVLSSAFTTLLYAVVSQTFLPKLAAGRNGTVFDITEGILSLVISLGLSSFLQFTINVTSASLLIYSLRRHIQTMRRNASGFWNPQTEAHVGAMKLMVCFLLLYVPYAAAALFLYLPSDVEVGLEFRSACLIISTFYSPGHSVLIILTHPKLKTKAKKILCFNK
ncbi:taste receptor type 2 member 4 [Pteropus alecto]|uniref:Taste receptor type 2 n=1 Tax=Pteropus alecto TaxID=9402 RepID=L5KRB8_PTEAL|nr:taste receptor type 2 member 4 [Pteropus alecto]ELK13790.1 Taste receptor type 2 member 4 [Pteropus alecto]